MKLSAKRRQAIYSAIAEEVTRVRIKLAKQSGLTPRGILSAEEVDSELFRLEQRAGKIALAAAEGNDDNS